MATKRIHWWLIPIAGLVLLDEWLKAKALQELPLEGSLLDPGVLAFAIHKNFGIAFDIPFKLEFVIIFSVIIGFFLARIAWQNRQRHPDITFACSTIIIGALGNFFDRIYYGFTVDYIILFGRSAINFSDIVIVSGVVLLLLSSRRGKKHYRKHPDEPRR